VRHLPRSCFTVFTPAFSQFGLTVVRPRLLAAPARCPAIPTPSSAPALAQTAPPPLLELAQALSRPIASPGGQNSSPELPRPAQRFSSAVSPSLTSVSWPQPHHRVHRFVFPLSAYSGDPGTAPTPATSPPREGAAPPTAVHPSRFDLPRPISIAKQRSRDTASRTHALRPGPFVSARVPWRWTRSVSAPPGR
jgi:hypothetical protein